MASPKKARGKVGGRKPAMIQLSTLKKNPDNPRSIRGDKFERLKKSLQTFPQMMELRPIVVDESMTVLGGNMRLEALKALGFKELPQEWVKKASELTDEQKREFVIKDNAGFGEWDWDALANSWDDLPLTEWGLDLPEDWKPVEAQQSEDESAVAEMVDKAAELQQKWQVSTGQIYRIGRHRLMCGDCTSVEDVGRLFEGDRPRAVLTDPPYGIGHDTNYRRFTGGVSQSRNFGSPIANDDRPFDPAPLLDFECVILWGANCYSDRLPLGSWLVWDKRHEGQEKLMSDAEAAWLSRGHGVYIFNHAWNGFLRESEKGKTLHPTQKPVELMRWCCGKLGDAPSVFDPYCGSGPVMAATEAEGRTCFGMEMEPKYCAVTLERMSALGLKPELQK